jgi:KDO2-lipid IV(A) lauroyltransferase
MVSRMFDTKRARIWLARRGKSATDAIVGGLTVAGLRTLRGFDLEALSNFTGGAMRRVGPLLPEHRIGRANLAAAFPEKSAAEIENILLGVWDNLGRFAAEFTHIDHLWDPGRPLRDQPRIKFSPKSEEIGDRLRDDGKAALIFSAHLANWEIPAIVAHKTGNDSTIVYRRPNLRSVSDAVVRMRTTSMGTLIATNITTAVKLADALQRGSHVGMLVDQYHVRGVPVTFFGRRTRANPMLARLARRSECPIHGARMIRLNGSEFFGELTDELTPVRDGEGRIDVEATTQAITSVVEGWVREHPEQWLWLHRRWRDE